MTFNARLHDPRRHDDGEEPADQVPQRQQGRKDGNRADRTHKRGQGLGVNDQGAGTGGNYEARLTKGTIRHLDFGFRVSSSFVIRISSFLSKACHHRRAGSYLPADLDFDFQIVGVGKINSVREPNLIMPIFCPALEHLAGPKVADDSPCDRAGNLADDYPPVRRRLLLQPDPRVLVSYRALGIQRIRETRRANTATRSPARRSGLDSSVR